MSLDDYNAVGLPLGSGHVFQVVPHGDDTFDVMDTRTKAIAANFATQLLAAADAISRNALLDAI
jgi:hypothetical protein